MAHSKCAIKHRGVYDDRVWVCTLLCTHSVLLYRQIQCRSMFIGKKHDLAMCARNINTDKIHQIFKCMIMVMICRSP